MSTRRTVSIKVPNIAFTRTNVFSWDNILLTFMATIFCIGVTAIFILLIIFWSDALLRRTLPITQEQHSLQVFTNACNANDNITKITAKEWECS